MTKFSLKVAAFVIRQGADGYELLAHGFAHDLELPLRFPGGGVDEGESIEAALVRELKEEAGIESIEIVRKLGVAKFYKSYSQKFVERHDFLIQPKEPLPDHWSHEVRGSGDDAGELFTFRWIGADEFYLIDVELQKYLDELHIPELFTIYRR